MDLNYMKELKSLLKVSGLKLNIIEIGCGCPISESFTKWDGASNYIYATYSPYNKEAQYEFMEAQFDYRSVSAQFVIDACAKLEIMRGLSPQENTIDIAVSMQAGNDKDNHGWICIDQEFLYHFTLGWDIGRQLARTRIVELVTQLIFLHYGDATELSPRIASFVDGRFLHPGTAPSENVVRANFAASLMPKDHAPFAIVNGLWTRLTEAFRVIPGRVNIVKGSFNPFHEAHAELMDHSPYASFLSITTKETVEGKESINVATAVDRIKASGRDGIIDSNWVYYKNMVEGLHGLVDMDNIHLSFSMGIDVFAKYEPINGVSTHVFARNMKTDTIEFHTSKFPDLSSTKIRENENDK